MNRRAFAVRALPSVTALSAAPIASAAENRSAEALDLLNDASQSVRDSATSDAAFSSWLETARQLIPFVQATALAVRSDASDGPQPGAVRRIYSTVPQSYPVGGWKKLGGSDWAETVLIRHQTLVASGAEELAHYFPDHELLRSLGTETLVNIPVVACNRTIGAFAFMCSDQLPAGFVTNEMNLLAALATPLFLISS